MARREKKTHNLGMALWRFSGGNVSTKIRHRLTSSTACLWYALPTFLMYLARERASKRSSTVIGIPIGSRVGFSGLLWRFGSWRRSGYVGLAFHCPALQNK